MSRGVVQRGVSGGRGVRVEAEGCEWRQRSYYEANLTGSGTMLNTLYSFCTSLSHLDVLLLQKSDGHEAGEDREWIEVDVGGVDHVSGQALWGVRKCGSESNKALDFHWDQRRTI